MDAHGLPVRVLVTSGTTADCTQAGALIEGIQAEHLLADRGYDSDEIVDQAQKQGMKVVIPPKKNRKEPRDCDMALYKNRHLVENAFYHLNAGATLLHDTLKMLLPFWLRHRFGVLHSGSKSCDDKS